MLNCIVVVSFYSISMLLFRESTLKSKMIRILRTVRQQFRGRSRFTEISYRGTLQKILSKSIIKYLLKFWQILRHFLDLFYRWPIPQLRLHQNHLIAHKVIHKSAFMVLAMKNNWSRTLETKYFDDKFEMMISNSVANFPRIFFRWRNVNHKMSPPLFCHQNICRGCIPVKSRVSFSVQH